jgi:hypothetical protein
MKTIKTFEQFINEGRNQAAEDAVEAIWDLWDQENDYNDREESGWESGSEDGKNGSCLTFDFEEAIDPGMKKSIEKILKDYKLKYEFSFHDKKLSIY